MIRFAANLTMMFTEWSFLDRFEAAVEAGFGAVEFRFPYEFASEAVGSRLSACELELALFNLPPGDWAAGERGIAALPHRFEEFQSGVDKALDYAQATGVRSLHMMAGLAGLSDADVMRSYRRAVDFAASKLAARGLNLLLETYQRPQHARLFPERLCARSIANRGTRPAESLPALLQTARDAQLFRFRRLRISAHRFDESRPWLV
jgi:hydroxypyruvate isomerase